MIFSREMNRKFRQILLLALSAMESAHMLGCGGSGRPKLQQVQGTITMNGQPVDGADVYFRQKATGGTSFGRTSRGKTNAEGKFSIGTYSAADGIPLGTYVVGVLKREPVLPLPPNFNPEEPDEVPARFAWIVPKKYYDPESSGLQVEVKATGIEPAVLNLESKGKPQIELIGGKPIGDGS